MARPEKNSSIQHKRAQDIFVDRVEPLALACKTLSELTSHTADLLVFYGAGGQGKSALCKEIRRHVSATQAYDTVHIGLVDLHTNYNQIVAYPSLHLRNAMNEKNRKGKRVLFPAFDLAFAYWWKLSGKAEHMPILLNQDSWLGHKFKELVGDSADKASGKAIETIFDGTAEKVLDSISIFKIGKEVTTVLWQRSKKNKTIAGNDILAELFKKPDLKPYDIEKNLLKILASDIEEHLLENPEDKFLVCLDEYEKAFPQGRLHKNDSEFDRSIRSFFNEINGTLCIIFGREKLAWEHYPDEMEYSTIDKQQEWTDYITNAHHLLNGLAEPDARDFLSKSGINDEAIQTAMIAGSSAPNPDSDATEAYPVMLDLMVEYYYFLKNSHRHPTAENFEIEDAGFQQKANSLLTRIFRDYQTAGLEITLRRLSVANFFTEELMETLVKEFSTGFAPDHFNDLAALSFIQRDQQGYYVIHSAIRDVLRAALCRNDEEALKQTHHFLFEYYAKRAIPESIRTIMENHIVALQQAAFHHLQWDISGFSSWWHESFQVFWEAGLSGDFIPTMEHNVRVFSEKLGETHPDIAKSLNDLGIAWGEKGEVDTAIAYFEKALAIREKSLPADHPDIAISLNNLGVAWRGKGEVDTAIAYHEQALAIRKKSLPADHPAIAASLNNLGNAWDNKGEYDKAIAYHEQALAIYKKSLPADHRDVAASLNNLGNAWWGKGEVDTAIAYHEQALAIRKKSLPADHPDVAASLNNLGVAWGRKGDATKAEAYYQKAREITKNRI